MNRVVFLFVLSCIVVSSTYTAKTIELSVGRNKISRSPLCKAKDEKNSVETTALQRRITQLGMQKTVKKDLAALICTLSLKTD